MKPGRLALVTCCGLAMLTVSGLATTCLAELTPLEQLGKELFFDKISQPKNQSCASCHTPSVGWTGAIPGINLHGGVYQGADRKRFGNRRPPASAYIAQSPVFHFDDVAGEFVGGMFWDGRATGERLGSPAADQALGPFLAPVEQNMPSKEAVCEHVAASKYAVLYEEVWGPGSLDCSEFGIEASYDRIGLSIAAYEASSEVSPFSSKFDAYWISCIGAGNTPEACGLAEGLQEDLDPMNILTAQEFDGLIEFGEYCSPCHTSHEWGPNGERPLFTDFTYENIGVPRNPENPFYDMDEVYLDNGEPINPLGDAFVDFGLGDFLRTRPEWEAMAAENDGKFKVPTVRNVDRRRAPTNPRPPVDMHMKGKFPKAFMHNGVFKSLEEVVHFYNTRDVPEEGWPQPEVAENVNRDILEGVPLGNLELDAEAEAATVAFLGTLSDGYFTPPADMAFGGRAVRPLDPAENPIGRSLNARLLMGTGEVYFELPRGSAVEIGVYDIRGRHISSLGLHRLPPGPQRLAWDGRDDAGRDVGNGVYFFRVRTSFVTETIKGVWIR